MEPQHNYSYGPGGMQQQVYGRTKSKRGCMFTGLILLVLFIAGTAIAMYFIFGKVSDTVEDLTNRFTKMSDKDKFTGTRNVDDRFAGGFIDALPVPSTGTTSKIFILTDASKTYIETTKRPGHFSTGVAKPVNRRNQYGGVVGFPIFKNKLFGFLSFDQKRETGELNYRRDILTSFERNPANWFQVTPANDTPANRAFIQSVVNR